MSYKKPVKAQTEATDTVDTTGRQRQLKRDEVSFSLYFSFFICLNSCN